MNTLDDISNRVRHAGEWLDDPYPANLVRDLQTAMIDLIDYLKEKEQDSSQQNTQQNTEE